MQIIQSSSTNPHFNLAFEEHLFNKPDEDFLLIYINSDAVVSGKHQNVIGESNSRYLSENNVPLIRRFSGGGTVFHDTGNINFSFISSGKDTKVIDFKRYAVPVVDFLKSRGVPARLSDRNDIFVEDYKISGHAAHAKNKRSLHHGTLLYNSDLKKLSAGLKSNPEKFKSRGVQSVRSKVTLIQPYLDDKVEISEFVELLSSYLSKEFSAKKRYEISTDDRLAIERLMKDKYQTFEWNYGYGPDYSFNVFLDENDLFIDLEIVVSKGIIKSIEFDKKTTFDVAWNELIGTKHYWPDLKQNLKNILGIEKSTKIIHLFF